MTEFNRRKLTVCFTRAVQLRKLKDDAGKEITAETREQLTKVRSLLAVCTRRCWTLSARAYEREHGAIGNSYQFLQLVMSDPWFAWLRQLSELIVEMDELLAAKETPSENTGVALIQQARMLLTPAESGSEFQKKYFAAMQQSPEVVLAHSEFAKVLGPARLSKEIH